MRTEPKTQATKASVSAFLKKSTKGDRLADCTTLVKLMEQATETKAVMWGTAIVGFDRYAITYADGRTSDWPVIAFSPRSTALVLYLGRRYARYEALAKRLGKHKQVGGCLHIRSLADVDLKVLADMVSESIKVRRVARTQHSPR